MSAQLDVIARLLDGWEPHPDKEIWWLPGTPMRDPMTPSEAILVANVKGGLRRRNFPHQSAAIIRAHQEAQK